MMPAIFSLSPEATHAHTEVVSVGVAIILITMYGLSMIFSMKTHKSLFAAAAVAGGDADVSVPFAIGVLSGSTALVALMSEFLVGALEPTVESLGMSKLFVGLIIIPIVGNAAEHATAVFMAARDEMEIAVEIAIGSSTQIAIFVAPVLVFVSLIAGHPMDFVFSGPEIGAVAFSTAVLSFIALDGQSNWFEGAELLATYLIMAVSFFFL
jgi:Ca2+:H+ antiporter